MTISYNKFILATFHTGPFIIFNFILLFRGYKLGANPVNLRIKPKLTNNGMCQCKIAEGSQLPSLGG